MKGGVYQEGIVMGLGIYKKSELLSSCPFSDLLYHTAIYLENRKREHQH